MEDTRLRGGRAPDSSDTGLRSGQAGVLSDSPPNPHTEEKERKEEEREGEGGGIATKNR